MAGVEHRMAEHPYPAEEASAPFEGQWWVWILVGVGLVLALVLMWLSRPGNLSNAMHKIQGKPPPEQETPEAKAKK